MLVCTCVVDVMLISCVLLVFLIIAVVETAREPVAGPTARRAERTVTKRPNNRSQFHSPSTASLSCPPQRSDKRGEHDAIGMRGGVRRRPGLDHSPLSLPAASVSAPPAGPLSPAHFISQRHQHERKRINTQTLTTTHRTRLRPPATPQQRRCQQSP